LWKIKDPAERVRQLIKRYEIFYYLRVPNEDACPTNIRMGTVDWPKLGLAELVHEAGENKLYLLKAPKVTDAATTSTLKAPPRENQRSSIDKVLQETYKTTQTRTPLPSPSNKPAEGKSTQTQPLNPSSKPAEGKNPRRKK
jgi:hypothetical protein